jgi:surface carbohydrate biosynthesis protein
MNIYIQVEISSRELDSKLLLATLAAAKGHQVIVSSGKEILSGIEKGILPPGIFHTKSLTPGINKINRHQFIIDSGSMITSIDEEGGLIDHGYDTFARLRYSEKTIAQSSAVFCWGSEDEEALKRIYSNYSSKIYKTGSPRVDTWSSKLSDYWDPPQNIPKKPFLLISSNVPFANSNHNVKPLHKRLKQLGKSGYLNLDPEGIIKGEILGPAEEFRRLMSFINAIKYLSNHKNGYDIVLRPHPHENIESWKILLEDLTGVHVIKEDSITAWVNKAFAVMHNSCTTALEATISGKPVVTYAPFKMDYPRELANQLGYRINSLEELSIKLNELFNSYQPLNKKKVFEKIPEILSKKIYIDNYELSADKMIKVWESIDNNNLSHSINWTKFQFLLQFLKLKEITGKIFRKLFLFRLQPNNENFKFPPLDKNDVYNRITRIKKVLCIDEKLYFKLLSERTILIKKY